MTDIHEGDEREAEMPEGASFYFSLILQATGLFDDKQQRSSGASDTTLQYTGYQRPKSLGSVWVSLTSLPSNEKNLYDTSCRM